jgi:hypothetical protein
MNIILIGPVSDNVERAKRVFALAEKLLTEAGHTVVHNPMRDHVPGLTEAQYMAKSLTAICEASDRYCDDLFAMTLPWHTESLGCSCEFMLMKKLLIQVIHSSEMLGSVKCSSLYIEHHRKEVTK